MRKTLLQLIATYRLLSDWVWAGLAIGTVRSGCRFQPTCSEYAAQAISRHGALRGTLKAIGRVMRCNPFVRAGFDPLR